MECFISLPIPIAIGAVLGIFKKVAQLYMLQLLEAAKGFLMYKTDYGLIRQV